MIRGGSRTWRIARLLACATAAVAVAAPATAGAQSPAVEEYTLDIPGGSNGSNGGSNPSGTASGGEGSGAAAGAAGSTGGGGGSTGTGSGAPGATKSDQRKDKQGQRDRDDEAAGIANLHRGESSQGVGTTSRPATEVVADTLFDTAMLPVLAALVAITAIGAWRVLRGRRRLSGQAG